MCQKNKRFRRLLRRLRALVEKEKKNRTNVLLRFGTGGADAEGPEKFSSDAPTGSETRSENVLRWKIGTRRPIEKLFADGKDKHAS